MADVTSHTVGGAEYTAARDRFDDELGSGESYRGFHVRIRGPKGEWIAKKYDDEEALVILRKESDVPPEDRAVLRHIAWELFGTEALAFMPEASPSRIGRLLKRLARGVILALGLLAALVLFCYGWVNLSAHKLIYEDIEALPEAQAAVILGAAILQSGDPSPVLRHRIDTAIRIYEAGKVEKLLVTGDNGTFAYNEVDPARKYLLERGIPEEDIFLDYAGFDTYSSMYRARDIFLAGSVIVVSQGFHLPRAIFIAKHLGLEAYGMKADRGDYLFKNYAREVLADVKAVGDLLLGREPEYLGEEIPISGDANGGG